MTNTRKKNRGGSGYGMITRIWDNMTPHLKLSYISGLREVVLDEIQKHAAFHVVDEGVHPDSDTVYIAFAPELLSEVKQLRSVARAYISLQNDNYHPAYISNHKSVLGDLIDIVVMGNEDQFKTFKITCAGSDSAEVRSIARYVEETYKLSEAEEADLKILIINLGAVWEIAIQITPRPLSVRQYRAAHMSGAMDPTIAYAMNSFCSLETAQSYLNIFSGSATLLIEAGQRYPRIERLIGFDNDKKHLSLSIQNIKEAGLITRVQVKEADIFDVSADLGTFDAITSDLPFGMSISKGENLQALYECFVKYCEGALNKKGKLVVYTSEYELLNKVLKTSAFKIARTIDLKFITSVGAYLRPRIFVCEFK